MHNATTERVIVLERRIAPTDIPRLCAQIWSLLDGALGGRVVCDTDHLRDPDVATVGALARMQLTAHRAGGRIVLRRSTPGLRALIVLAGLCDVLPELPVEPQGQPEHREELLRVEEERDPADPVA